MSEIFSNAMKIQQTIKQWFKLGIQYLSTSILLTTVYAFLFDLKEKKYGIWFLWLKLHM